MKHSNKIDFLSWSTKISNINRGLKPIIIKRKVRRKILSIIPFYDDGLEAFSSQPNMFLETNQSESDEIMPDRAKHWLDVQNPRYKINKIMWNEEAKIIENSQKDHWRNYSNVPISELKNIPDWLKNDSTVWEFISTWIGELVFHINYSKETIKELKLKFDKWFVYFDWLKYIFKKISCTKKIRDEIFEMNEEEYKEMWKLEMESFLKA